MLSVTNKLSMLSGIMPCHHMIGLVMLSLSPADCHIQALYAEWYYGVSCYAGSCYAEF
jgi:hypothetical protein